MDSGADAWMVDRKTAFEQGLRAEGADERGVHRDSYNQPDTEAAGEGRVNLTKPALSAEARTIVLLFATFLARPGPRSATHWRDRLLGPRAPGKRAGPAVGPAGRRGF